MCSCYDLGSNTVTMPNVTLAGNRDILDYLRDCARAHIRLYMFVVSMAKWRFPVIHYRCHTSGILARRPSRPSFVAQFTGVATTGFSLAQTTCLQILSTLFTVDIYSLFIIPKILMSIPYYILSESYFII